MTKELQKRILVHELAKIYHRQSDRTNETYKRNATATKRIPYAIWVIHFAKFSRQELENCLQNAFNGIKNETT